MQPASDEKLMQRLIQSLSELEQLGGAIIAGQSNFGMSGQAYLQVILKTLRITKGAILRFDSIENQLVVESSISLKKKSVVIPISSHEIAIILQSSILDLSQPPVSLKPFFDEIQPQLQALDATLWAPLKIRKQFFGIISLSSDVEMEKWERELLNVLASQTSIVIAHSCLIEEMRAAKFRLFLLSDMTAQISKQLDTESLEEEVMSHAISLLDASAGYLMLIDPFTRRLEITCHFPFDSQLPPELEDFSIPLRTYEKIPPIFSMIREVAKEGKTCMYSDEKAIVLFGNKNLMAVPIFGREILGVLVVCDKQGRGHITLDFTAEDQILLESFATQAGVAIENARLYREAIERRRLQAEMEEAAKIQENLLPDSSPEIPGYEVAGLSIPGHDGVGGDFFDYIPKPDGSWGFAIADVSGKGMQAALLMVMLWTGLRSEVARQNNLPAIVMALNSLLYENSATDKYATLFYAHLHPDTDMLTSINAGHNFPLLIRHDGNLRELEKGGLVIGMYPNDMVGQIVEYEQETTQLLDGDTILFYTDGVTEALNIDNEVYGEERLEELAKQLRHANASEICTEIYNSVIAFQGEALPSDDLTLMVVKKVEDNPSCDEEKT